MPFFPISSFCSAVSLALIDLGGLPVLGSGTGDGGCGVLDGGESYTPTGIGGLFPSPSSSKKPDI